MEQTALILPLVEYILSTDPNLNLSSVKIVGVQHILETTHAMFRSLFERGLKPENVSLIGKCYSTNQDVYHEMLSDGITVCPSSLDYHSHESFDFQFKENISNFIEEEMKKPLNLGISSLIILDDGGKCLESMSDLPITQNLKIVGIEQTTSGYDLIKNKILPYPVINVARSPVKLEYESPLIAQAAIERIDKALAMLSTKPKKCLIIGGGAIGKAIYHKLNSYIQTDIFDTNKQFSSLSQENLPDILPKYDCIIGCTGRTTIPKHQHKHLSPNTVLISASSSDREFEAVHLRRQISPNSDCHSNLKINGLYLLNSGFPINFDGERENIIPELIQLTIALITAGIIQSVQIDQKKHGILPLNVYLETMILEQFLTLI